MYSRKKPVHQFSRVKSPIKTHESSRKLSLGKKKKKHKTQKKKLTLP